MILAGQTRGQLIATRDELLLSWLPVEIATDVPPKLQGEMTLSFEDLDICFDGGSQAATFRRSNGGQLMLFFPHSGYWTPAARRDRKQPVAVVTRRQGKVLLVEIEPDSKLNQRIVELIDADMVTGGHTLEKLDKLKRLSDCIRDRSPLKEIADRMDSKTGELKLVDDPFSDIDPFDGSSAR